jgi:hypothetical protein
MIISLVLLTSVRLLAASPPDVRWRLCPTVSNTLMLPGLCPDTLKGLERLALNQDLFNAFSVAEHIPLW